MELCHQTKEEDMYGAEMCIRCSSTIGIVIAADGTFTDIPRENYAAPEEKTVNELKKLGKPFIVLLNSTKPYSDETKELAPVSYTHLDVYKRQNHP